MPDDIVNPVNPVQPVQPEPTKIKRDEYVIGDMVSVYGAGISLNRFHQGQQGTVRKVEGEILTVAFIPEIASDLSTGQFHVKQVRRLKQIGGRTLWLSQSLIEKVLVGSEKPFDVLATYAPQEEPTWLKFKQQTVEYEEEDSK